MKQKDYIYAVLLLMTISIRTTLNAQTTITHNISTSSLTIPGSSANNYIITGTTNTNQVIIEKNYKGTITFRNLSITSNSTHSPVWIKGEQNCSNLNPVTNVNIVLEGDNYLTSERDSYAAFQVDQGAQINIDVVDNSNNNITKNHCNEEGNNNNDTIHNGTLSAIATASNGGAGIGARNNANEGTAIITGGCTSPAGTAGGNIIISGGTVTARGGHAAGIGGGWYSYYNGIIVVYGGVVNASSYFHSAGIGSGCPIGTGVVSCYAPNSAIIALPPAQIQATGSGLPSLGLAGANQIAYIGDTAKPLVTVRTVDYTPNANIYVDLSQNALVANIVNAVIPADRLNTNKIKFGSTDSITGLFQFNGELKDSTTFFTDALNALGRPYMPKTLALPSGGTVVLELFTADMQINKQPSIVLREGYSATKALENAVNFQIIYSDSNPMTAIQFEIVGGTGSDFLELKFYAADGITEITAPTTLNQYDTIYVAIPLDTGRTIDIYSDVFRFNAMWKGNSTGNIYQVFEQSVSMTNDFTVCDSGDIILESSSTVANSFTWYSDANYSDTISALVTITSDTVFYVEMQSIYGCVFRDMINVILFLRPELIIKKDNISPDGYNNMEICYNQPATPTSSSSDSVSLIWYSDADYTNIIVQDSSFETSPLTADTVFYAEAISPNGCISRDSVKITISPPPVMDDVDDISVCPGINQTVHFAGTNINLDSSVWTSSNSAIGLQTNGSGNISFITTDDEIIPLSSTITVIPKSDSGCVGDSKTFIITVNPPAVMDSVDNISVCSDINQAINFTGTNLNLDSSVWTNPNPVIGLDTSGTGNISFITTNTGTTPLTSIITVMPKSDSGCVGDAKTFTIIINPPPVVDNVESISVCPETNQTINFTGTLMNADSSMWTNSDSAIGLGENGTGNISFITTNTGTTPLISTVTVIPKNNEGCIGAPKTFTITVYPKTYIHATANDSLFCEGTNVVFEVTNLHELNNIQWTGIDGFSSSLPNPDIQNLSLNNAGIYIVTAMTQDNCEAVPDSLFISVLSDIVLDMEDTVFICNSGAVIHSNASNATQYLWSTGKRTDSIAVSSTGEYWVRATNQRCLASDTTYVVEIEIPDFEIDTIGELCQDGSMELYVELDMENLSYRWTTGDTTSSITILRNGVYGISVLYRGCTVLQNINIECLCDFFVPNIFTPNGDGLNDVFLPVPTSEISSFLMNIFDRWGNLMFQTNTLIPWDGTSKGNYAIAGVYSYIIYYSCTITPDKKQKKQGRITLMR
jgi:gliding motility-associated-like protein